MLNLESLALPDLSVEILAGRPPPSWNVALNFQPLSSSSLRVPLMFGAPSFPQIRLPISEHWHRLWETKAAFNHSTAFPTTMSTHQRQEHAAAHGLANNQQLHHPEQLDGKTRSKSTSDVGNHYNV